MRTYRAHPFTVEIPEGWTDATAYALWGPLDRGQRPGASLMFDPHCKASSTEAFAEERVEPFVRASGGWERVRETALGDTPGRDAHLIELRLAADPAPLFRRAYYRLLGPIGCTIVVQLTRRERKLMGRAIDRMVLSLAPRAGEDEEEDGADAGGDARYRADAFTMDLLPGWEDVSLYRMEAPAGKGIIPNLVVHQEPWAASPGDAGALGRYARAEREAMEKAIEGFALLAEPTLTLESGASVPALLFRRPAPGGLPILQAQAFCTGAGRLYTLCVTEEDEPAASEDADAEEAAAARPRKRGAAAEEPPATELPDLAAEILTSFQSRAPSA